ncbi:MULTISPECIES: hypothetical protein [unclassified Sphingomonas]|jgi:hypothetical protein|uniref:hypothetical protein n=1 Tax=unclassified Sphingomonas TaxID=196159 RepID=UPI00226AEB93|nr:MULTISPECIES: hypothetical protein [unclassified Sphingomonas]
MSAPTPRPRKGRRHGAAMMAWMFFANLFEPKKAAAIEQIDTHNRVGSDAWRTARAAAAPASPKDH